MTLKETPYFSAAQPDLIPSFCEMLAQMVEPGTVEGEPAVALVCGGVTVATLVVTPLTDEMLPTCADDSEPTVVAFFERNLPDLKHLALPFLNELRGLGFPELIIHVEEGCELIATRNNTTGVCICMLPEELRTSVE